MAKTQTNVWLHEAREAIKSAAIVFSQINSMTTGAAENLFIGVENAIKAPMVEKIGQVPPHLKNHKLMSLCQSTGLWIELPPNLQSFVQDMSPFDPNVRYPDTTAYQTLVSSSTPNEWQRRLTTAPLLVEFVEKQVIAIPSVLSRITVP